MSPSIKVSDLFVECLENEGVTHIFGVPGEENEDLLFSLEDSKIKLILTRHEQGAAFMADVWGRLTGKAGVCLSTLGPGATNLMTGVADANLDKSPLVAITGQTGLDESAHESHQYLNIVNMFHPITKWNAAVSSPESVPEIVRKAFKTAEMEKPGATHIELSEDVAALKVDARPLPAREVRRADPDQVALKDAVGLLKKARKPLILAGNGAIRKDAARDLRALSHEFHIPVTHTFMGQGAVDDLSDYSLHTIGLGFRDIVMDAVDQADLILSVGYDTVEYEPELWNPKGGKPIIHVDFSAAEVYTHYQPSVEIVSDVSASLRELTQQLRAVRGPFETGWYAPVRRRILEDIKSYDLKEGKPFTVPGALNILREVMAGEDLLISDVGAHKLWIARNFPVCCPKGCLISNGLASMGIALPGAIAASLQNPKRRIVAAMGDGGFMMNVQELETAKRLGVAFTAIIFNDNDYGLISWKQRMHKKRSVSTRIENPDFKMLAESFGIKAYRPKTAAELRRQLKQAVDAHELSVLEIPVDNSVNDELVAKSKK